MKSTYNELTSSRWLKDVPVSSSASGRISILRDWTLNSTTGILEAKLPTSPIKLLTRLNLIYFPLLNKLVIQKLVFKFLRTRRNVFHRP